MRRPTKPPNPELTLKYVAKVMAHMSLATVGCENVIEEWLTVERIERTFLFLMKYYSTQSIPFLTMGRRECEELAKTIVTHHIRCAHSVLKKTVNYFASQGISRRTVYNIIKKYSTHLTTDFLLRSGRPSKISDKQLKALVQTVENKTGVSQRRLRRRFSVH